MTSAKDVVLQYVIPSVGGVVSVLMFLSSMPAVLKVRKTSNLGELNILPYPAIIANCIGWVCYSFVKPNGFILGPNAPGILIGLYYLMTCIHLPPRITRDLATALVLVYASIFIIVGSVTCYAHISSDGTHLLWGYTSNAILLTYYAAPLTTLARVWRSGDALSLSVPMSIANACNGGLWMAYGIAINDNFVAVPNGIGLLLALVLLFTLAWFWKRRVELSRLANGQIVSHRR